MTTSSNFFTSTTSRINTSSTVPRTSSTGHFTSSGTIPRRRLHWSLATLWSGRTCCEGNKIPPAETPRSLKIGQLAKITINRIRSLLNHCKSLPFFYCLNFEKADCSIFALSVGRPVGWSVGWSDGVTIIFFLNIYGHTSLLLTQYHFIQALPIYTDLY